MLSLFQGIKPVKRATRYARCTRRASSSPQRTSPRHSATPASPACPVVTGLYALLLPLLAFATFGSSRYLVVAADSATAAILRSGLNGMAPAASARYVALAGLVALLTAGFLLLARLFKLGFIADFLSRTVLVGFLTGVGFQVGISVLGQMLGVPTDSHKTLVQLYRSLPRPSSRSSAHAVRHHRCPRHCLSLRRFAPKIPGLAVGRRRCNRSQRSLGLRRTRHRDHRPGRRRPSASRIP